MPVGPRAVQSARCKPRCVPLTEPGRVGRLWLNQDLGARAAAYKPCIVITKVTTKGPSAAFRTRTKATNISPIRPQGCCTLLVFSVLPNLCPTYNAQHLFVMFCTAVASCHQIGGLALLALCQNFRPLWSAPASATGVAGTPPLHSPVLLGTPCSGGAHRLWCLPGRRYHATKKSTIFLWSIIGRLSKSRRANTYHSRQPHRGVLFIQTFRRTKVPLGPAEC